MITYSLVTIFVLANPVTTAFDNDELILTGPSPWNIFILFNFIGSIVSSESKPSIPDNTYEIPFVLHYITHKSFCSSFKNLAHEATYLSPTV